MNMRIKLGEFKGPTEEDLPLAVRQSRINTPALIILLGSTAALSALELMKHMLTLRADDQRKVALVYIDTDEPSGAVIEFRQFHNGVFQEFPLRIAVPVGISQVDRIPQDMGRQPDDLMHPLEPHTFVEGKEPQYFSNGAGGIRNNGHVAACFHHQTIYDTLERALASIMRVDMRQNTQRKREVQVHIVTFMGGGTGSGILADITVMIRDLLSLQQYEQRIDLFCMMPEPVKGVTLTDLSWRKSNTTACLLELVAFSLAAGGVSGKGNRYEKRMRRKVYYLTKDAIANEVFLIGQAAMDDPSSTARLVGLDLFQRITDASGIGFLEHSKQVDRRTLGETDDRGLPTMFGTSCPLEVRFPAEETAKAFAQFSAANLLPLLAQYQPRSITVGENDRRDWIREWNEVAPIDANPSNTKGIRPGLVKFDEFEEADQARLDLLWARIERTERETEQRIKEVIAQKVKEEMHYINAMPREAVDGSTSLLNLRIQRLQLLQAEYTVALESLNERPEPRVPRRPVEQEAELTQPSGGWFARVRNLGRDHAYVVFDAYNRHMFVHALATRHAELKQVLTQLIHYTQEALKAVQSWFEETDMEDRVQELESKALTSLAWQGRLDDPHPHQRHIFDLRTLRASDGRSIAAERLYLWATGGDKALNEGTPIEYGDFVDNCINYLGRKMSDAQRVGKQDMARLEEYNAGRLPDRVVDYFYDYYLQTFQDMNLFELLDKASPPSPKGQSRVKQLSGYLLDHLQHMRGLMTSLVAFEAELWGQGQSTLDTSIYLGMHWRDGYQRDILFDSLNALGSLTKSGQQPTPEPDFDPHRLQACYGQHAISLATIRDFYLEQNSSMEAYEQHQSKWINAGTDTQGYMPTHSSQEAQRLVRDDYALFPKQSTPLYKRLIRRTSGVV